MAWTRESEPSESWTQEYNTGQVDSGVIWSPDAGMSSESSLTIWTSTAIWTGINWTKET
tara:strand:+ start:406 stop:582 length:177 start_codon:yes stop_codon:yes gene_type:complete